LNKSAAVIILILCSSLLFASPDLFEMAKFFEFDAKLAITDDFGRYTSTRKGRPSVRFITKGDAGISSVLVIAEEDIYGLCSERIDRYIQDIEQYGGYSAILYTVSRSVAPEDIKTIISGHYYNDEITGVVLFGDVSTAWYEIADDFKSFGYALFPIDLYYMDMDGVWIDSDSNGIYDINEGNVEPEIWIGRIHTGTMHLLGSEEYLLNLYLDRNHQYWTGQIPLNDRIGLTYTDRDWSGGYDMKHDIILLCGVENHESYEWDDGYFSKPDYLTRIGNNAYGMIQFACHSGWDSHHMTDQPIIYCPEIFNVPPDALAYNLFCCSGCRWTAPSENDYGYLGGAYVFNADDSDTLFAVGSTKTGSMLGFSKYYWPLGEGKSNGEAFKEWWIDLVGPEHDDGEKSWFYGMTIVGDPLVRLNSQSNTHFSSGDGTQENPYLVETPNQLYFMRYYPGNSFRQNSHIDMNIPFFTEGDGWWPIGEMYNPFIGNYDGNNYHIQNLVINRPGTAFNGFFGYVENSNLKNIVIKNASIDGRMATAGITGAAENSNLQDCYVYDSNITGTMWVGGIAGNVKGSTITGSYSCAEISGASYRTGGLAGTITDTILSDCCSSGIVKGQYYTGGLVGSSDSSLITNCYSRAKVTGDTDTGGLIGKQTGEATTVTNSYWDTESSGQTSSAGGSGRTTGQMTYPYSPDTYTGWDFAQIWDSDDTHRFNKGYPLFHTLLDFDIDLSYFNAAGTGSTASLEWGTLSERNILGFNLYRIIGKKVSPFLSFAPVLLNPELIEGQGGVEIPAEYLFEDSIKPQGVYIYILESLSEYDIRGKWRIRLLWR